MVDQTELIGYPVENIFLKISYISYQTYILKKKKKATSVGQHTLPDTADECENWCSTFLEDNLPI